jgi:uncharacterized protein (TIGR03435 family)
LKLAGVALVVFGCSVVRGQTASGQPAFEVASIKPSAKPTSQRIRVSIEGGPGTNDPTLFECRNCSVSMLMMRSYDVKYHQLAGPGSRSEELFDITARVAEGTTKDQLRLMLQNLLADRFKLTFHREMREMQMYQLVVAKNGPKIKESVEDDSRDPNAAPARMSNAPADGAAYSGVGPRVDPGIDKDGFPILPPGRAGMIVINGRVRMQSIGESMDQLSSWLANQLDVQVIDSTGLKAKYDFSLYWAADSIRGGLTPIAGAEAGTPLTPARGDSGPTLFDAIQSQLGLKLEQKKGPVEIIVVDHVEKIPTGN